MVAEDGARVLELLQRKEGASLAELVAETGWLPHTTRAALTRLRQSGHELQKEKRDTGAASDRPGPRDPLAQYRLR